MVASSKRKSESLLKKIITYTAGVILLIWIFLLTQYDLPTSIPCALGHCSNPGILAYLSFLPLIICALALGYGLERGTHRTTAKRIALVVIYSLLLLIPVLWIGLAAAWLSK